MRNSQNSEAQNARLDATLSSRGFRFGAGLAALGVLAEVTGIVTRSMEWIAAGELTALIGVGVAAVSGIVAISNQERIDN